MSNLPKSSSPRPSVVVLLLRQLKQLLTSSYGIAAIASLSFHGVLFAAIPRFSSVSFAAFSDETVDSEPRTVPLVTLSPEDQGRLPNFNRPKLPEIPNVASNRSSTSIRNLPSADVLRRTPTPNIFERYSSSSRIPTPSVSSINRNRPFRNPYSIPRPNLSITNTPSKSDQSSARRTTVIDDIPAPPAVASELDTDRDAALDETLVEETLEQRQSEVPESLPELPEQSEQASATENPEEVAANPETERQLTQLERLQAKFKYNADNTTDEEADANYEAWVAPPEGEEETTVEIAEVSELRVDSGLNLCVENPPTNGKVGILVTPDGTSSAPAILRSTGYDYLNEVAVQALIETEFPETEIPVRYPFDVIVDYDTATCQSGKELLETVQSPETVQDVNQNVSADQNAPEE
ncbi:MAG: hypothetical protein AAGA46_14685 [Cyanobacteria bacterium P01_F01_bin.13]